MSNKIANMRDDFAILEAGIRQYAPVIAEFFNYQKTLEEHAKSLHQFDCPSEYVRRQTSIIKVIKESVDRLYGADIEPEIPLALNIVDHHAPLTHPMLVATNIVANAHRLLTEKTSKSAVVLSSAIVPPNNFLNKKGFHLNGKLVSIFSANEIHQAAYWMKKRDFLFVERLKQIKTWETFSGEEQAFLQKMEIKISSLDFSRCIDYADQVGIINQYLWKELFSDELKNMVPDLKYITAESVMADMVDEMLTGTLISAALFNNEVRKLVLSAFDGISGCWSTSRKKGTHFFWLRSALNIPEPLFVNGDYLESADAKTSIHLDAQTISEAVKSKRIMTSSFIIYTWLHFYLGIRPLGGYGSTTYITKMKEAWLGVLQDNSQDKLLIESVNTKGLIGGEIVTYSRASDGVLKEQYAFDIIFRGGLTRQYLKNLLTTPFIHLLRPALLDIYTSYVPVSERERLSLKFEDMIGNSFDWIKYE